MIEKRKCPCPNTASNTATMLPRDTVDIEWLVEQRVQRTLAERQNYSAGLYDGILYALLVCGFVALIFWPEIKKVVA